MPKKEQLVKIVTTDDKGRRHITWERQMVEENPVQVSETPLAIVTLPLGNVQILRNGGENYSKCRHREKLYENDIIKTASKSRVEIKLPSGGEVDEKHIIRVGEQSKFVVTADNLRLMGKSFEGTVKKGNVWVAVKATFGQPEDVNTRMPTAVAAIAG
jgi:hypothetical protein